MANPTTPCYNLLMEKRLEGGRPLCIGDDNTCPNVAGLKEKRDDGTWRYHTRCDKHRRNKHRSADFRNPNSTRYIPLEKCELCTSAAEERHRIVQGVEYTVETVVGLCRPCHYKIHNFYNSIKAKGYTIALLV